uniref:Ig-like domain-containing protein n=1 Tax=Hucho hucho TaxID=62062 RepID=A0A4W5PRC5_9TELE
MTKLTLIRLCFWLYLAQTVVSEEDVKVGGELVLKLDKSTVSGNITSILWKHGKNKVAEWDKDFGNLEIYGAFINRTTLDSTTGELRISGLKKTDSGVYSVEFNSKLLDKTYKLSVIEAFPKPTITSSCNANKTSCTLTCEGDTTDAERVTYSWKVGEGAWEVIGKQLTISKSDTGKSTNSYKYMCKMKNSAGEGEVSEPFGEVFGPEPSNIGAVFGVVCLFVAALVSLIVWLVWKKIKGYPQDTWIDILRKYCGGMCGKCYLNLTLIYIQPANRVPKVIQTQHYSCTALYTHTSKHCTHASSQHRTGVLFLSHHRNLFLIKLGTFTHCLCVHWWKKYSIVLYLVLIVLKDSGGKSSQLSYLSRSTK